MITSGGFIFKVQVAIGLLELLSSFTEAIAIGIPTDKSARVACG